MSTESTVHLAVAQLLLRLERILTKDSPYSFIPQLPWYQWRGNDFMSDAANRVCKDLSNKLSLVDKINSIRSDELVMLWGLVAFSRAHDNSSSYAAGDGSKELQIILYYINFHRMFRSATIKRAFLLMVPKLGLSCHIMDSLRVCLDKNTTTMRISDIGRDGALRQPLFRSFKHEANWEA